MAELPTCSVIVPTHERPAELRGCLEALAQLDYPRSRYEVIVVADGASPAIEPLVARLRGAIEVQLIQQPNAGPGAARNRGAASAEGELLAFTDDDCRPRPDWLRRLAERARERPGEGVGGRTVTAPRASVYATAAQLIVDVGHAHCNAGPPSRRWFPANNLAVPREGFEGIGGFDPAYRTAEDRDFCARWTASGLAMSYEPRAVVAHTRELTLAGFIGVHFGYGRGAFWFHRGQRVRWNRQPLVEPRYYATLTAEPVRRERGRRAVALEALLVVWHLSNSAGFTWEWVHSRRNGRPT